jgi:UDP-N-acetylmuramyl pentapeptide phosphotransferase/UDP-N-acetylglucosamine-1-phosphate transferase
MIIILIISSFILCFIGTWIVIKVATLNNIIDIPNSRSSHKNPTPSGGGLAIAIIWYLVLLILYFLEEIPDSLFLALLWGIPITIIGFFDDIVKISPKLRLIVQIICAFFAVYFLGFSISVDLGFFILKSKFLLGIVAIIAIIWFINLFNFLDGIDGYISVEILFICLAVFLVFDVRLPLIFAAATSGFLIWNWQPAKIFMGDVGSTLIGFTIAVFAIYYQNPSQSSIIVWLMLTSLFWFDATYTIFRRLRNHEVLSDAHKKHAYQRIVQYGFSHKKTVISSLIVNLPILGLSWFAYLFPKLLLPFFCINLIYLYLIMRLVDKRFPFKYDVR